MIASKLILFFCFCLLRLDNSLGQRKTLLETPESEKLLRRAFKYGNTYGGELEELGLQLQNLIQEIAQAKRKVGLGKYQLARFNDSATEEVDLANKGTYADKVAAVAATRSEDISKDKKYIDDLETLKDEIALAMIVKIEETEEKFKIQNVRKKVKEAKENGITDSDIKEILFAEYLNSGGLPLIGGGASTGDALLSSFRKGIETILDGNYFAQLDGSYYEKFGILEYGNGIGCFSFRNCGGGGGRDTDSSDAGEDGGAPDNAPGGGGAPGGKPPGGGGGGAPGGKPPGGGGGPPDDGPPGEEEYDEEDDEPGGAAGGEHYNQFGLDEDADFFAEISARYPKIRGSSSTYVAEWILNRNNEFIESITHENNEPGPSRENPSVENTTGILEELVRSDENPPVEPKPGENPLEHNEEGPPTFLVQQRDAATVRVNRYMEHLISAFDYFEEKIEEFQHEYRAGYYRDPSLQSSSDINHTARVKLYTSRIDHIQGILDRAKTLRKLLIKFWVRFRMDLRRTLDNFEYFSLAVQADDAVVDPSLVLPDQPPPPLQEFRINEHYTMRYLISRIRLNALFLIRKRYETIDYNLKQERFHLQNELGYLKEEIVYHNALIAAEKERAAAKKEQADAEEEQTKAEEEQTKAEEEQTNAEEEQAAAEMNKKDDTP